MTGGGCPVCGKLAAPAYRPFCSRRCADVDLGRWLGGHYRLPGPPAEGDEAPQAEGER
ncbi:MAG TPA: DNA gyrase inhibitor YacG [Paracoccaceae bacterium]|nr:DNA gyrase inhibitor YacG [Paracoccaceae bacterium]